ncbi:acyl carrier protein [Micromonospora sp. C95]|uniref:acyl carrier protein n=1 Tax=Micromonospora sp. C95 TaxID=2824882 RepID=UPI001B359511|nr:acyl carrier protein [Micromonospora sp. C95]MBQ1026053.1 acyl carrier protein [Micromonospora sp. C95]
MSEGELTPSPIVAEAITRAVGALAPDPRTEVGLDEQLVTDLGFDSLRMVELSLVLEELFALDPNAMDEVPPVGSVGDLVAYSIRMVDEGKATLPEKSTIDSVLDRI